MTIVDIVWKYIVCQCLTSEQLMCMQVVGEKSTIEVSQRFGVWQGNAKTNFSWYSAFRGRIISDVMRLAPEGKIGASLN